MLRAASFEAVEYARQQWPREACGLYLEGGRFQPLPNIASSPDAEFEMPADAWVRYGKVLAVWHSHPNGMAYPSAWDMRQQAASAVPWIITPLTQTEVLDSFTLGGLPEPLLGREFRHGVNDCYSLVRDWFKINRGIVLPPYPRQHHWWHEGENLFLHHFQEAGFKEHNGPVEIGDCCLLQLLSKVPNHCAVYVGAGQIMHHLEKRLSRRESIGAYARRIVKWVRYAG